MREREGERGEDARCRETKREGGGGNEKPYTFITRCPLDRAQPLARRSINVARYLRNYYTSLYSAFNRERHGFLNPPLPVLPPPLPPTSSGLHRGSIDTILVTRAIM